MRLITAISNHLPNRVVMKVAKLGKLASQWSPSLTYAVPINQQHECNKFVQLHASGIDNLVLLTGHEEFLSSFKGPSILCDSGLLKDDDVITVLTAQDRVQVNFRKTDQHHTVFLTNRCNSNCLMCSQPPTRQNDSWLIEEAKAIAKHLSFTPDVIGFTGGEPLLLGRELRKVLDHFIAYHSSSHFEILTNGQLLSDRSLCSILLTGIESKVTWMIPLYGHADFIHDFIVQSPGAFDHVIDGLLNLQTYGQPIQLRIVLITPVLEILPDLCDFIARNLPFVQEVALMGCEPIGFALANAEICKVDISEWSDVLIEGVTRLHRQRIPVVLMNLPHCVIPSNLWPIAHQSISDWKQYYADECEGCDCREQCSGLFMWANDAGWTPAQLRQIKLEGTS